MKKTYITPETQSFELHIESHLLSASFNGDNGSIGKDDNGDYSGEDALSREDKWGPSDIWNQGW